MHNPSEVRSSYAAVAALYTRMFGAVEHVHPADLDLLRRRFTDGPVLDLGCGPGHLTSYLDSIGLSTRGIDLVPEFVTHARATYPHIPFEVGSMTELTCPASTVAGVLAWYSLIHVPPDELDATLAAIRRVLRPDGVLVVGFFSGNVVAAFDHKVTTAYTWPTDELSRRLASHGFTEIERQHRDLDGLRRTHGAIVAKATRSVAGPCGP